VKQPFDWEQCYRERTERLVKLIKLHAPKPIVENECRLVLLAIAKNHATLPVILRWLRYSIGVWFAAHGWSQEKTEEYFEIPDEEKE
jgi:hypothetical protein